MGQDKEWAQASNLQILLCGRMVTTECPNTYIDMRQNALHVRWHSHDQLSFDCNPPPFRVYVS